MSFRVSALAAGVLVLGLGSVTPVSAQPVAPIRPRTSPFGSIFTPGMQQQQLQQQMFMNQALGAGGVGQGFLGPGFVNPGLGGLGFPGLGVPGVGYPGALAYQSAFPGAFAPALGLPPSGVVGTFNNYGHWYNFNSRSGSGYYGHWYPNGVASGRGVLGFGGGYGGGYGGGLSPIGAGPARMGNSMMGNVGGTALGVGAMMNQFRR
jgi:hypothetical protein